MVLPTYRILLIDDNEADAALVERHLKRLAGFSTKVLTAGSHKEGLLLLEESGADCVVLDYRLGPQCGLETLRAIREGGDDTAVVFVTGFGSEMVAVEALQCGAQDYLIKSVLSPAVLQRAILNAVEKVALGRKIDEKRRELEDFVSVVAHDLQQPLCAVKGNVELIRDFYGGRLDEQGLEFVEAALRTSGRMAEMIDALLGYARAGRKRAPVANLNLNQLLDSVQSDVSELLLRKRAHVEVGDLPPVGGDPVTLAQLFQNLITNAVKFHGEEDPNIAIGGERRDKRVVIWVRDNGMGIPADLQQEIFAPFRRLAQAKGRPGSGIGLATCKKIVEQHRGAIWVESEPGRGSTFFIELQASAEELERLEPASVGKVLLVDDDPADALAMVRLLEQHGMFVHQAAGAIEAANLVDGDRFDAMVVNLTSSHGHGLDLIRYVAKHSPATGLLALAADGDDSESELLLAEARQQGAGSALPKPVDETLLAALVRKMVFRDLAPSSAA